MGSRAVTRFPVGASSHQRSPDARARPNLFPSLLGAMKAGVHEARSPACHQAESPESRTARTMRNPHLTKSTPRRRQGKCSPGLMSR